MDMFKYSIDDKIAILTMNSGENRFNMQFLEAYLNVLDEIEKNTDANVLVVKSSHEKIFSNGIDLDWLMPYVEKDDKETSKNFIKTMMKLFRRVAMYPMTTIAAVTGHAFAGGAILCCYFDYRFMRTDRGYFCFPEVDIGIPFLPGMMAAMKKAIPMYKLEEMVYEGKRLTAKECEEHNIVTGAYHQDELMGKVFNFAKGLNKRREIIFEIKKQVNKDIIHAIDNEDKAIIEMGKLSV